MADELRQMLAEIDSDGMWNNNIWYGTRITGDLNEWTILIP